MQGIYWYNFTKALFISSIFYIIITTFLIIRLATIYRKVKFTKAGRLLISFNVFLQTMPFFEIVCLCIQFFYVLSFSAKACFGDW